MGGRSAHQGMSVARTWVVMLVYGDKIQLYREARGLTKAVASEVCGLSVGRLTELESSPGEQISCDEGFRIADGLQVDPSMLWSTDFKVQAWMNRTKKKVGSRAYRRLEACANLWRIQIRRLLSDFNFEDHFSLPKLRHLPPENRVLEAVDAVKRELAIPDGAILDLTRWLEQAGAVVLRVDFGDDGAGLDAFHCWCPGEQPFFFINRRLPADRYRFTLAHELGHAVMHLTQSDEAEVEANEFAGELLLPGKHLRLPSTRLNLKDLLRIKKRWNVSMASVVYRARSLGKISESEAVRLFRALASEGYFRSPEPSQPRQEACQLLEHAVGSYQSQHGLGVNEIFKLVGGRDPWLIEILGRLKSGDGSTGDSPPTRLEGAVDTFKLG